MVPSARNVTGSSAVSGKEYDSERCACCSIRDSLRQVFQASCDTCFPMYACRERRMGMRCREWVDAMHWEGERGTGNGEWILAGKRTIFSGENLSASVHHRPVQQLLQSHGNGRRACSAISSSDDLELARPIARDGGACTHCGKASSILFLFFFFSCPSLRPEP